MYRQLGLASSHFAVVSMLSTTLWLRRGLFVAVTAIGDEGSWSGSNDASRVDQRTRLLIEVLWFLALTMQQVAAELGHFIRLGLDPFEPLDALELKRVEQAVADPRFEFAVLLVEARVDKLLLCEVKVERSLDKRISSLV